MQGPDKPEKSDGTPDLLDPRRLTLQEDDETGALPQITRLPEGISVVEQRIGQASGQWIFCVRCECGRRWFDTRAVDTAQCPRCGLWVQVKAEPRSTG